VRGTVHPDAVSAVNPRIKATTILLLRRDMVLPRSSEDYLLIECRSVCPRHMYNTTPKTLITSVFAKIAANFFQIIVLPVRFRPPFRGTGMLSRKILGHSDSRPSPYQDQLARKGNADRE
jgi:hypothetical protein